MVLGQADIHMQKNEARPSRYTVYKYYLKRIKDVNVRAKNIKFLKENVSANIYGLGFGNDLWPKYNNKVQGTTKKINWNS